MLGGERGAATKLFYYEKAENKTFRSEYQDSKAIHLDPWNHPGKNSCDTDKSGYPVNSNGEAIKLCGKLDSYNNFPNCYTHIQIDQDYNVGTTSDVLVDILDGATLQGQQVIPKDYETPVDAFLGIQYAEAKRFSAPVRYHYLENSIIDVTKPGNICPQVLHTMEENGVAVETMGEDCLNANVWRPSGTNNGDNLPVYVFIHGGAFELGSGTQALFNGENIVSKNAEEGNPFILVSINYRLGILGSFYKNDETSGNYGILDQKSALKWVNENIEQFGGNTSDVTIFGESAGAMSIGIQLMDEEQNGDLYQRAIMESNPYGIKYKNKKSAKRLAQRTIKKLHKGQHIDTMQFKEIIDLQTKMAAPRAQMWSLLSSKPATSGLLSWAPYIDEQVIKSQPNELATIDNVDVTLGFNTDESNIFVAPFDAALDIPQSYNILVDAFFGIKKGTALRKLPEFKLGLFTSKEKRKATTRNLLNQTLFYCPSQKFAQQVSEKHGNVSLYKFEYKPEFTVWPDYYVPSFTDTCKPSENSCHGAELPFVFGNELNLVSGPAEFSEKDREVKNSLMTKWLDPATFALYQDDDDDNITILNVYGDFVNESDWDNRLNNGLCQKINAIMYSDVAENSYFTSFPDNLDLPVNDSTSTLLNVGETIHLIRKVSSVSNENAFYVIDQNEDGFITEEDTIQVENGIPSAYMYDNHERDFKAGDYTLSIISQAAEKQFFDYTCRDVMARESSIEYITMSDPGNSAYHTIINDCLHTGPDYQTYSPSARVDAYIMLEVREHTGDVSVNKCQDIPAVDISKQYKPGNEVSYQGNVYRAERWTDTGRAADAQYSGWVLVGPCA
ncbi:putative esterase [Moritella sp. JT01]|nr:putative esterase [Moritella sp. JT01]